MLNDKFVIEASCNYVYRLNELKKEDSTLNKYLANHYPNLEIIDLQEGFNGSNLALISIQERDSLDVAIIYQGSTDLKDWRNDNLNNFLNKNVQQYEAALTYYDYLSSKGYRITYLGGNSLGGGCAQYVGLKHPLVRALAINASPLTSITRIDTKNIYNIRVISDPLYRCVLLDSERFENGYVGNLTLVNRSLYGSYDYFNNLELAHRGSIVFPYDYIYHNHKVNTLQELKEVVDPKKYQEYMLLRKASSLAQFMSFDLVSNNYNEKTDFDLDELQHNFSIRIKEINNALLEYTIPHFELKIGNPFLKINDQISDSLKMIIKHSLLHITKQEEKLYDNIYFIIEKSTNYFYKLIASELKDILEHIDASSSAQDYEKIINDINLNKVALNKVIDYLISINDELYNYDKFQFKNLLATPRLTEFSDENNAFSLDYKEIVYAKIDTTLSTNIAKNRLFIEQLEKMIGAALLAKKVSLQVTNVFGKSDLSPEDIDYVIKKYNLASIFEDAIEIFRKDIYEAILAQSLLYNYQTSILSINEQLKQLDLTIINLEYYLSKTKNSLRKRRIIMMINDLKQYLKKIEEFNEENIII